MKMNSNCSSEGDWQGMLLPLKGRREGASGPSTLGYTMSDVMSMAPLLRQFPLMQQNHEIRLLPRVDVNGL